MNKKIVLFSFSAFAAMMFVASGCRHKPNPPHIVSYKGKYICISLRRYTNELYNDISSGLPIPADIDTLFGMTWLDGYVIDNKNSDIILVGEQKKSRPVYHAEDLFINYQSVFDSIAAPYCSLDPKPENIKKLNHYLNSNNADFNSTVKDCQDAIGGQKVVIGGVPPNSRVAKIMIYADYDMKKISQGLLAEPLIKSTIDLSIADTVNGGGAKASMSRFWLHIKESKNDEIYPNYIENPGIVFINQCPVVVLTEKQYVDSKGNLSDNVSEEDRTAVEFANEMGKNYDSLAKHNILFAELENMFRLQACLKAMKLKAAIDSSGINLSKISNLKLAKGNELPSELPGLINYKILKKDRSTQGSIDIQTRFFIVAGGVSQDMKIDNGNLRTDSTNTLTNTNKAVIKGRPHPDAIYWYIEIVD